MLVYSLAMTEQASNVTFSVRTLQAPLLVPHVAATLSQELSQHMKRQLSLMLERRKVIKVISKLACFDSIVDWHISYV